MFEIPPFQIKSWKMKMTYNPSKVAAAAAPVGVPPVVVSLPVVSPPVVSPVVSPVVVVPPAIAANNARAKEVQTAAVQGAAVHSVGGVARGSGKQAAAVQDVASLVAKQPVAAAIATASLPLSRQLPQQQQQQQQQQAVVRDPTIVAIHSSTIDGTRVPPHVKHARQGLTRQKGKSLLGVELGFLSGMVFGLSMAVLCFLCWQGTKTGSGDRKRGSGGGARVSTGSSRSPSSGTPFRKSH